VVAIALAACGSSPSSSSTSAATTNPSSTPSGPPLSDSTPVTSPQFRARLVAILMQQRIGTGPQSTGPVADCAIKGLPALGIKTRGDFDSSSNTAKITTLLNSCLKQTTGK
jgi:hypothetical protein